MWLGEKRAVPCLPCQSARPCDPEQLLVTAISAPQPTSSAKSSSCMADFSSFAEGKSTAAVVFFVAGVPELNASRLSVQKCDQLVTTDVVFAKCTIGRVSIYCKSK